ncbi:hypothetical protein BJ742DRAFT_810775 [Cladochytrium replicatum]|nr:hypothetical protein BJ742DRAFT_810775 [Cladochytrium replicatum]
MERVNRFTSVEIIIDSPAVELTAPCSVSGHFHAVLSDPIEFDKTLKASVQLTGNVKGSEAREGSAFEQPVMGSRSSHNPIPVFDRKWVHFTSHPHPQQRVLGHSSVSGRVYSSSQLSSNFLTIQPPISLSDRIAKESALISAGPLSPPASGLKGIKSIFRSKQKSGSSSSETQNSKLLYDFIFPQGAFVAGNQTVGELEWRSSPEMPQGQLKLESVRVKLIQVVTVRAAGTGSTPSPITNRSVVFESVIATSTNGNKLSVPINVPATALPSFDADPVTCYTLLHLELLPNSRSGVESVIEEIPVIVLNSNTNENIPAPPESELPHPSVEDSSNLLPSYTDMVQDGGSSSAIPSYAVANLETKTSISQQLSVLVKPKVDAIVRPPEVTVQQVVIDRCVSIQTMAAHLGLLYRFAALTQQVKAGAVYVNAATASIGLNSSANEKVEMTDWVFLCRAELRYIKWLRLLKLRYFGKGTGDDNNEVILPPLDVALFWHAHMLNPLRYYEDTYRMFGVEQNNVEFPLMEMHSLPGLGYNPPEHHQEMWLSHTNHLEPFSISVHDQTSSIYFSCPLCDRETAFNPVEYVKFRIREGRLKCADERCGHTFSCDSVSLGHFLADITAFVEQQTGVLKGSALSLKTSKIDLGEAESHLDQMFRADVPHGPTGSISVQNAVKQIIQYGRSDPNPNWENLLEVFRTVLRPVLRTAKRATPPMFAARLAKAYRNIPFKYVSLDLIAAVVRQRGFTAKMASGVVDWSSEDTFSRATVRYHKFLLLMSKHRKETLVPTLDLDLAWHTHQLFPGRYQNYGLQNVGVIINHDDSVDETSLISGYDNTSTHWKTDFGEEYAQDPPTSGRSTAGSSTRFPAYALFASSKSNAAKQKRKADTSVSKGGACTFYESNSALKQLREKGELGRYSKQATCSVCGTYVLLTCGGYSGDWGLNAFGKNVGSEQIGACGVKTPKSLLICGSRSNIKVIGGIQSASCSFGIGAGCGGI